MVDLDEEDTDDLAEPVEEDLEEVLKRLEERAKSANLTTRRELTVGNQSWLVIEFPAGRGKHSILYAPRAARALESATFEDYHFFSDLEGCVNTRTGDIEVRVGSINNRSAPPRIWMIPGAEHYDASGHLVDRPSAATGGRRPASWRLRLDQDGVELEISPTSPEMTALDGAGAFRASNSDTLKLRGFKTSTNEEALKAVHSLGGSLLFEIDLKYRVSIALTPKRREFAQSRPVSRDSSALAFPKYRYNPDPLALYNYGRSASGLPLLEFLAYYQAVEYYFSAYANADTVRRVQNILKDPLFDSTNELAVSRVIVASHTARRGAPERDNLRIVLRACVEVEELERFIQVDKRQVDHFCSKNQTISGVRPIQLAGAQADLRDQVADRMYAIRCRVVHTKEDGGDGQVDLLLPTSREARSLAPDVQLARLVAQRVLIARSGAM